MNLTDICWIFDSAVAQYNSKQPIELSPKYIF
jgi:hypothetical protein